ncbi:MAG: RNA 2',3'-cyclic phosphodiesterase [Candidatus Cloacimonetes bacterium HGW-Cloacimonetes-1]|jgi:2'-5' RNA ligase|nr:MAG: RNA 2',3'-cyclic phosphodiesterase [Candidatus Cloacimonetes bacterium HGW-Cloacimonetes-1]
MLRTFIALEIPEEPRRQICEYLKQWQAVSTRGINWVKPENLHLTLLFIGDTEPALVPRMIGKIERACELYDPFPLSISGCELFPAVNPRLLWAKLVAENRSIYSMPAALNKELQVLGIEPEIKALKLHITMARLKSQQPEWLEREFHQANFDLDSFEYDTLTLYQSVLRPDGPVYTPLEQFSL